MESSTREEYGRIFLMVVRQSAVFLAMFSA